MHRIFFSYCHTDEGLRDRLEKHLATLKHQGLIEAWHDRGIDPGQKLDDAISKRLEEADVILLLVSSDFLSSDYCYKKEMGRALERNASGEATVIPVILRACDWKNTPLGELLAVPTDAKPITKWPDEDEAFLDVVSAIRRALKAKPSGSAPSSSSRGAS